MSSSFGGRDAQNLAETIRRLEARVAELERVLDVSGNIVTMKVGNSVLRLKPTAIELSAHEITLTSSGALKLKASGDIVLKGQKIHEN